MCDISHPDHAVQHKTVIKTLRELNLPASKLESMITVFNKCDLLNKQLSETKQINKDEKEDDSDDDEDDDDDSENDTEETYSEKPMSDINIENNNALYISCKTGQGLDQLVNIIQTKLMTASDRVVCEYRVLQGGQLYQILVNGDICTIENMIVDEQDSQYIRLKCFFSKPAYAKFQARYCGATKYQISNDS